MNNIITRIRRPCSLLVFSLCSLLGALPRAGQAQFTYVTNSGAITITGYTGPGGEVVIPGTIGGLPVTTIGDSAFYHDYRITSVFVPEGVLSLENHVLADCLSLTNVALPASLRNIGASVLAQCPFLPETVIPGNVTNIGGWAFSSCPNLGSVRIPDNVLTIGDMAFYASFITNATIGRGVISLGNYAFAYCWLGDVFFLGDAPQTGAAVFNGNIDPTVHYLPGTSGWSPTFCGWPTALWLLPNPVILTSGASFGVRSNTFGFIISWAAEASVVVEATTAVGAAAWLPISTNTLDTGWTYFNDPNWAEYSCRLYRVSAAATRILARDWITFFRDTRVGDSAFSSVTISNAGNSVLTVSNISYPDGFSGDWSGTIAPRSSHEVVVEFSPTAQRVYTALAYINSDATSGENMFWLDAKGYFPVNSWTLWWQNTNGETALWQMSGTNLVLASRLNPTFPGAGWRIVGTADFNRDNHEDLIFQNADGRVAAWLMSGTNRQTAAYLTPSRVDPTWHAMATGDLNSDGRKDILWQRDDGSVAVWLMNGLVATQSLRLNPATVDQGWRIAGTGDFNGDGKTDILWQNAAGRVVVWLMNGVSRTATVSLNGTWSGPVWVVGTKDFNGDGHPGIIWQIPSGSPLSHDSLVYWQMDNTNLVNSQWFVHGTVSPSWTVVGPR